MPIVIPPAAEELLEEGWTLWLSRSRDSRDQPTGWGAWFWKRLPQKKNPSKLLTQTFGGFRADSAVEALGLAALEVRKYHPKEGKGA